MDQACCKLHTPPSLEATSNIYGLGASKCPGNFLVMPFIKTVGTLSKNAYYSANTGAGKSPKSSSLSACAEA